MNASGQELTRVAPECRDVLAWRDGAVAMGVRPLGHGYVVDVGYRTDGGSMLWGQWGNENILFRDLLAWRGLLEPQPHADIPGRTVPFVSNNGLYDVTMVWAESVKKPSDMTLHFPGANAPATLRDVAAGATLTGQKQPGETIYPGLRIQPNETRGYLAPRNQITQAPLAWLRLQRAWWSGTLAPPPAPRAPRPSGHAIDLSEGWSFHPLGAKDDAKTALSADPRRWEVRPLGVWNYPNHVNLTRGIAKKTFTIPAAWRGAARIRWNFFGVNGVNFFPPYQAQVYLDGKPLWESHSLYDMATLDLTDRLVPGPHTLAIVNETDKPPVGPLVNSWVEFVPTPARTQDLSGQWSPSKDGLVYAAPIPVPGAATARFLRRTFTPDPQGDDAFLYVESPGILMTVDGVLINDRFLPHNGPRGTEFLLNITPWLRRGAENTITIVGSGYPLKTVELRYYAPKTEKEKLGD